MTELHRRCPLFDPETLSPRTVGRKSSIRPFCCSRVSRCIRIETDVEGRLFLDPDRAKVVKAAIGAGVMKQINAFGGGFPKKDL